MPLPSGYYVQWIIVIKMKTFSLFKDQSSFFMVKKESTWSKSVEKLFVVLKIHLFLSVKFIFMYVFWIWSSLSLHLSAKKHLIRNFLNHIFGGISFQNYYLKISCLFVKHVFDSLFVFCICLQVFLMIVVTHLKQ